jgi:hypothetical protein
MIELLRLYRSISQYLYLGLLTILAIFLPFSVYIVSMCEFGLMINLILEGDYKKRLQSILNRKSVLVFLGIYVVHLIWLLSTSDIGFALQNIKIKLPLLILPVIIAASLPLSTDRLKLLLRFFIASLITGTLISTVIYLGLTRIQINDIRSISIFISHIRFSLLIVIAILVLMKWIVDEGWKITHTQLLKFLIVCWFIVFLVILKSFTGIVVLIVTIFVLILTFIHSVKFKFLKTGLIILLLAIPLVSIIVVRSEVRKFYNFEKIDINSLEKKTVNGNAYNHHPLDWNVENGHKVWMYVCQPELRKEWNKRSNYKFDSFDMKQQPLIYTLIRYMTSKGLRKDSVGVSQLNNIDISSIEHGITNVIYTGKLALKPRLYEIIWEFDQYKHGSGVNKHSVTQRIIYMQIALHLIRENFWFGVGTGDLPSEYARYYKTHETGLSKDRQLHTHNQFLRFIVLFGIFGFLIIIAAFIIPVFLERKWSSYYMIMIITIILLSFLNEDTLETQIGVTFSVLFYSLFLWGVKKDTITE